MTIRPATNADIPRMIALADAKRTQYEQFAPTFWRKAADGAAKQTEFFHTLLTRPDILALVSEGDDTLDGFVIASVIDAPSVYDPGSQICLIDDFTVADSVTWHSVGRELLFAVGAQAARGAHLTVVVCGHRDELKRAMLRESGFALASEWYVSPL